MRHPPGNSRPRTCPHPFTMLPMVGVRAHHFAIDDRVLHGLLSDLGMTDLTQKQSVADSLPHWRQFIQYSQLQNSGWDFARRVETDGVSISVHFVRSEALKETVALPFIGRQLTATSDFNPHNHIAAGVDPGVTQAIKAAHAQRHPVTGRVLRRWEWELTKGQLKHDSGLTKAKRDTARCPGPPAQALSAQAPPPTAPAQDQPPAQAPPGPVPQPQAPPWGRWLDRDTNPCLNFQRIGESMQHPLELCSYEGLEALPAVGTEYQQGCKRVNDRLPKGSQRLHQAAEHRRGIDGWARNNALA
ncbi:hypothetical protein QJQ45_012100 [Haematococcus lacustris]|nr:hypothetical protein QJQ45_012100 [Haematococcus lacustris]